MTCSIKVQKSVLWKQLYLWDSYDQSFLAKLIIFVKFNKSLKIMYISGKMGWEHLWMTIFFCPKLAINVKV